jgi:hypothetical protein
MMILNKKIVGTKLLNYLQHKISLTELVNWAENAIMKSDFESSEAKTLREVLGKLGLADVKMFGLTWDECEKLMRKLGYKIKIEASLAA